MPSAREIIADAGGPFGTCPVVMICQDCPYAWEPADFAGLGVLLDSGCPNCGGWAWVGELLDVPSADAGRADA